MQRGDLPCRHRRGRIGNLLGKGRFGNQWRLLVGVLLHLGKNRLEQRPALPRAVPLQNKKIDTGNPCAESDTDPLNLLLIVAWER